MRSLKKFLNHKKIIFSFQSYAIDATSAMAQALFATLVIGLILQTFGQYTNINFLIVLGNYAKNLLGAAIGIAVALSLNSSLFIALGASVAASYAADIGGPLGAFVAGVVAAEAGKAITGETRLDIILIPFVTIISGGFVAFLVAPSLAFLITGLGLFINYTTNLQPLFMSIIISIFMGMILTSPISSAAIAIMLNLDGLAAGAATVGCCAQMIGFAITSYEDNDIGVSLSQAVGTSMLQIGNIFSNPRIWIAPTLAGAMIAPIATVIFQMKNIPVAAGMGSSGLIGQLGTFTAMGFSVKTLLAIIVLHFIAPAVISLLLHLYFKKIGWVAKGDMTINKIQEA